MPMQNARMQSHRKEDAKVEDERRMITCKSASVTTAVTIEVKFS